MNDQIQQSKDYIKINLKKIGLLSAKMSFSQKKVNYVDIIFEKKSSINKMINLHKKEYVKLKEEKVKSDKYFEVSENLKEQESQLK